MPVSWCWPFVTYLYIKLLPAQRCHRQLVYWGNNDVPNFDNRKKQMHFKLYITNAYILYLSTHSALGYEFPCQRSLYARLDFQRIFARKNKNFSCTNLPDSKGFDIFGNQINLKRLAVRFLWHGICFPIAILWLNKLGASCLQVWRYQIVCVITVDKITIIIRKRSSVSHLASKAWGRAFAMSLG